MTSMLRGVGDTITPLLGLVLSILVSLLVTPALIEGWFGLPALGIIGASVANIIGFFIVIGFLGVVLKLRKSAMAIDGALLRNLRINWPVLKLVIKLGIPAGVVDGGVVDLGDRHRRHRQPLRRRCDRGLWGGQPGDELCAVPGHVGGRLPPRSLLRRRSGRAAWRTSKRSRRRR